MNEIDMTTPTIESKHPWRSCCSLTKLEQHGVELLDSHLDIMPFRLEYLATRPSAVDVDSASKLQVLLLDLPAAGHFLHLALSLH